MSAPNAAAASSILTISDLPWPVQWISRAPVVGTGAAFDQFGLLNPVEHAGRRDRLHVQLARIIALRAAGLAVHHQQQAWLRTRNAQFAHRWSETRRSLRPPSPTR